MTLSTDRRTFLKTLRHARRRRRAIAAAPASTRFAGRARRGAGRIRIPISSSSIRGSSSSPDNTATFYVGKTDCGQGTGTAFRQMMSDELDIAFDKTDCVMGSTDITVDQGGSGGSDAIQVDGWPMRRVAAEARRVLLDMASARFGVPVDQLAVSDGVITREERPVEARHLRRTDRRQAVQRRAHRQQRRRDDRRRQGEGGAGPEDGRPVAAALRHSRARWTARCAWAVDVKAAGHGARAQREAAGRRRDARRRRRVVRQQHARIRQGRDARATTSRSCASAKSRRSGRRGS